jgi:fermentation-respiration switch protein FrsA (DUF1100 family)
MRKNQAGPSRNRARAILALAALTLLSLALDSCASTYFYDMAIARNGSRAALQRSRDLKAQPKPGGSSQAETARAWQTAWFDEEPFETVSISSEDGLRLVGYWLPAEKPSRDCVILAHGYTSRARYMSDFARFYREELGFNVLMPDARGHGASEGDYIGMGWPERRDYVRWITWLIGRQGEDSRIVLHGVSMGGATVLMASGEALPPNVRAVIEDCGYTSADEEFSYQIGRLYHLPRSPIIPTTSRLTKQRAGYSFEEASALAQVRKSRTSTLFIHGEDDNFVPFEMVKRLYAACPADKALFVVPGAGHGASFWVDRQGYTQAVRDFLGKRLGG